MWKAFSPATINTGRGMWLNAWSLDVSYWVRLVLIDLQVMCFSVFLSFYLVVTRRKSFWPFVVSGIWGKREVLNEKKVVKNKPGLSLRFQFILCVIGMLGINLLVL